MILGLMFFGGNFYAHDIISIMNVVL